MNRENKRKVIDKILNYIERNRVSSIEVADALNKTGVLDGLKILNPGHFAVGKISYVYSYNESNWLIHKQLQNVDEDSIVYIDTVNANDRALFGDLVSKYLILYKNVKGIVVNGLLRDAHRLRKENYPIWCKGVTPLGCFNKEVDTDYDLEEYFKKRKKVFENSVIVCDDSGCTLIDGNHLKNDLIKKLEFIELQEDIWYFCVDTLKMTTFDAVCNKKYISDNNLLPDELHKKILKFEKLFMIDEKEK